MKKLLSLTALLLCILMVFASCGGGNSLKPLKIDKGELNSADQNLTLTVAELTAAGEDFTYSMRKGTLLLFTKVSLEPAQTTYKIINIETGATVMEKTISAADITAGNASVSLSSSGSYIVVYAEKTYTVYQPDGTTVLGTAKTAPYFVNDCVVIGDTVIRYDLTTYAVRDTYTYPAISGIIPSCTDESYEYSDYYIKDTSNGFTVYDKQYKYIGTYEFPDNAEDEDYFVLKSGNIFVQYLIELPDDAAEYDIYDGYKFQLVQKIVKAKNLSEKELTLDYFVNSLRPYDSDYEGYIFKKEVDNMAVISKIVDGQFTDGDVAVSFKESGEIALVYDERFKEYNAIGNGYLYGKTKDGVSCILDKNLDIVYTVGGLAEYGYTTKYLVTASAIYDYNGAKLADLITDTLTYTYAGKVGGNLIFTALDKNGEADFYLYDGAFTMIADTNTTEPKRGADGEIIFDEGGNPIYESSTLAENFGNFYIIETTSGTTVTTKIFKADKTELASYTEALEFETSYYSDEKIIYVFSVGKKFVTVTIAR